MKRATRILLALLVLTAPALGHLHTKKPRAVIEAVGDTFDSQNENGVLHDQVEGRPTKYLKNGTITQIRGFAHNGMAGLTQQEANQRISVIQIWGWRDADGDGKATLNDGRIAGIRTTKWVKLSELRPSVNGGNGTGGNVVGWNVTSQETSGYGDILQISTTAGDAQQIVIKPGESWLLLIRVVDTVGNTNLFDSPGGSEVWDDGDTSNGIGSDLPAEKYLDANGNTPGTTDARIDDRAVVWVYVPR